MANRISYKQRQFVESAKNENHIISSKQVSRCFHRKWTYQGWLPWKNAINFYHVLNSLANPQRPAPKNQGFVSSGTAKLGPGKVISIHFKILRRRKGWTTTLAMGNIWNICGGNDSKSEHPDTYRADANCPMQKASFWINQPDLRISQASWSWIFDATSLTVPTRPETSGPPNHPRHPSRIDQPSWRRRIPHLLDGWETLSSCKLAPH